MVKVVWSDKAATDIEEIVDYLETQDVAAAASIGGKLFALGESLSDFPNRGRPARNGARELTSVPPYVLRYRVSGDQVSILRIRHGRRRPLPR